ncbi:hypothetical protein KGF57_003955 [Candida theae]|uniref:Uncharacterized protein n=1 Tax=Candida theae TaxID=1198502 RepID=A0AAD5FX89_9ASCO|nr:uncharacterized protein KGF57_003955 [Candida theae]KAI5953746.1 hypothetical protein KGF57_003955 [Candida theae]
MLHLLNNTTQLRAQISGVMGSTSLACWIVLLMPQLIEQWRLKSAEGIAIGFISIWFAGDLFNLIGAIWANLLPEVIFLAVWFCVADALMIWSYVYYTNLQHRHQQHHHHQHHHHHDHNQTANREHEHGQGEREYLDESAPLLHRRRSSTLTDIALEPQQHSIVVKYILPIIFVVACGMAGFLLSSPNQQQSPQPPTDPTNPNPPPQDDPIALGPQIMGYVSAFLYLGARIPQIIQNYQRKSVYGLSLLFFLFSTLGNLTYAGQIIFFRSDWNYIVLNMSWLLGSLGTIVEDVIIFGQFYMYKDNVDPIEDDEGELRV